MLFAILIDLVPFLTYFGLLSLIVVVLVVGFWDRLETPLIRFLEGIADRRAERKRRQSYRKAIRDTQRRR